MKRTSSDRTPSPPRAPLTNTPRTSASLLDLSPTVAYHDGPPPASADPQQPAPPGQWTIALDIPVLPQPAGNQLVTIHPQHGAHVPAGLQRAYPARPQQRLNLRVPVPAGWPTELTHVILNINLPPSTVQGILPDDIIMSMSSPYNVMPRLNRSFEQSYQPTLAIFKWNHCLSQQMVFREPDDSHGVDYDAVVTRSLTRGLALLVGRLEHRPADSASAARNTLALMFSHPAGFAQLYQHLLQIWRDPNGTPPAHLDLTHLPEHALFAAVTLLDPNGELYDDVLHDIESSLTHFPQDVQANVLIGLWLTHAINDPAGAQRQLDGFMNLTIAPALQAELEYLVVQCRALTDALTSPPHEADAKRDALPLGQLLSLLESLDVNTSTHVVLLERLTLLQRRRPFDGSDLQRLEHAISDQLKLLLDYAHPNTISTTAAGDEIMRLGVDVFAQVFLKWSSEEQIHLLNSLEYIEATELVDRLLGLPDNAEQTIALRSAIQELGTADGVRHEVKAYIAARLQR